MSFRCVAFVIAALFCVVTLNAQRVIGHPKPFVCTPSPCTNPPPTITYTPGTSTDTLTNHSQKIVVCSQVIAKDSSTFNGALIAAGTTSNGCETQQGTFSLVVGQNTFATTACSGFFNGNQGSCGNSGIFITHPAMAASPKNLGVWFSPSVASSQLFHVSNYTTGSLTYSLTVTCTGSGVTGCSVPANVVVSGGSNSPVTVTFNTGTTLNATGTIKIKATNGSSVDSGWVNYTILGQMFVSTAMTNLEDQDYARCYSACFANTVVLSTPAYYTRDQSHTITLTYNSDRVALRPILQADVQFGDSTPTDVQLTAQIYVATTSSWTAVNFFNSDANKILHFQGSPFHNATAPMRIGGQFDASGYQTNATYSGGVAVYPLRLVVTAQFASHQEQVIDSTHHLTVYNTRTSAVANGWTISTVPVHGWGTGSPESQTYIVQAQGNGSVQLYGADTCNANGCVWASPHGAGILNRFHYDNQPWSEVDYPDSTKEFFYPDGRAWMRIDRFNDTTHFGYDSQNRIDSITDPFRLQPSGGHHTYWEIVYGANGISEIIEPGTDGTPGGGRVTHITVNSNHMLTGWQDPDTVTTTFGYNAAGLLDSVTDRNRHLTRYAYDPNTEKLDSVITAPILIDSNSTGSPVSAPLITFNAPPQTMFLPTSPTSGTTQAPPVRTDTAWGYVTNTAHHSLHIQVDGWGQLTKNDAPTGYTTAYARDANGYVDGVTNSGGRSDSYEHSGPFLTMSSPQGSILTFYSYGAFGQIAGTSGPQLPTTKNFIGAHGHIDSVRVNNVTRMRYFADASGRDTLSIDSQNDSTHVTFDSRTGNTKTMMISPGGRSTTKTFDRFGRDSTVYTSGNHGIKTTTLYDSLNRVVKIFDGVHTLPTIKTYDNMYLLSITDPANQTYSTTYNAVGWAVTQTDPSSRTVSTTYNGFGYPATLTNRRGQRMSFTYDNLGRIKTVRRPAVNNEPDSVETFTYTLFNDTITVTNATETDVTFLSRPLGWPDSVLTTVNGNHVFKKYYHHDSRGRIDSVGVSTRNVTGIDFYARRYFYDTLTAQLDSIKLNNQKIAYKYNSMFLVDSMLYPNGVTRADSYASNLNVDSTAWTGLNSLVALGYAYDSSSRLTELDRIAGFSTPNLDQFTYNGVGELATLLKGTFQDTIACHKNQNGFGCTSGRKITVTQQDRFVFDSAGNLDTLANVTTGVDTASTTYPGDRLKTWAGMSFSTDSDGDQAASTGGSSPVTYTWSADGRLLQILYGGGTTRTYDYNGYGQLVRRRTNGTADRYYIWEGNQILAILDGAANARVAEFAYFAGGPDRPIARITGSPGATTVHYLIQDALGNVVGQFSGTTLEQTLIYEPWGKATTVASITGDTTQLRWKGLLDESDVTGLYYMRARWYDPVGHRFISPDPAGISAGLNQFAFANGDPINGQDPTGRDELDDGDPGDDDCGCTDGGINPGQGEDAPNAGDPGSGPGGDPAGGNCTAEGTCGAPGTLNGGLVGQNGNVAPAGVYLGAWPIPDLQDPWEGDGGPQGDAHLIIAIVYPSGIVTYTQLEGWPTAIFDTPITTMDPDVGPYVTNSAQIPWVRVGGPQDIQAVINNIANEAELDEDVYYTAIIKNSNYFATRPLVDAGLYVPPGDFWPTTSYPWGQCSKPGC